MRLFPSHDMAALVSLKSIVENFERKEKKLIFCGLNHKTIQTLKKANFKFEQNHLKNFSSINEAIEYAKFVV